MSVPSTYANAGNLSANSRAALAGARLEWDELSPAMRDVLRGASPFASTPVWHVRGVGAAPTRRALEARGLIDDREDVTPLGMLVREIGTRSAS